MKRLSILLVLLLAGCSDAPAASGEEPTGATPMTAPTWVEGMYWTYATPEGSAALIVTNATAETYVLDTNLDAMAYYHARSVADEGRGISYLGNIGAIDLSGSQGSDAVRYYQWPLVDGLTWQSQWDDETLTIQARPEGDGFAMEARNESGELRVRYDYDPALEWFSYMHFYGNDTVEYALDLEASGENYTGEYVRYEALDVVATGSAGLQESRSITTNGAYNTLRFTYDVACTGTGHMEFKFGRKTTDDPASQLLADDVVNQSSPCGNSFQDTIITANDVTAWQVFKLIVSNEPVTSSYELLQMRIVHFQL